MSNQNPKIESDVKDFTDEDRKFVLDFIDMFSAIKGKPLRIFFKPKSDRHYITYEKHYNQYTIVTDPEDKKIFWKTAIEHEVSHLLFDTKFLAFKKIANKIINDANTPYELKNIAFKSIHSIYNVFEDMRIESWFGKYKQGFKSRIIKTRKSLGQNKTIVKDDQPIADPISALLYSRFFRNDLVRKSDFKKCEQYINDSEFLNPKGSILLVKKFYDEIFLPYLIKTKQKQDQQKQEQQNKQNKSNQQTDQDQDQKENNDKGKSKGNQKDNSDFNDPDYKDQDSENTKTEKQEDKETEDSDNEDQEDQTDNEDSDNEDSDNEDSDNEDSDNNNSGSDNEDSDNNNSGSDNEDSDNNNSGSGSDNKDSDIEINSLEDLEKLVDQLNENNDHKGFEESGKTIRIDLDNIEKQLEKSKQEGLKDFKELKEKLLNIENNPSKLNQEFDQLINRQFNNEDLTDDVDNNSFEVNHGLASKLTRIFDQVKGKRKNCFDVQGSSIDIKNYVNAKFDSNVRVFKNEKRATSLNIFVIDDLSGSMNHEEEINGKIISRSQIATNTISTMFKAIQKYDNVKLSVNGFTGNHINKLQTVKVKKLSQVGKLNNGLNGTLLDLALINLDKEMKKVSGKKFVIILTDGMPDCPHNEDEKYFNYLVNKLFYKKQIGCFGILIGDHKDFMKSVFGKNFATCDLQNTETELIKVFEKTIKEYLQ